jgi:tRNA-specific 2-thiouridylase
MAVVSELLSRRACAACRTSVAVAMSGGVDSSVAAALLALQGHEVIGLTMHLWTDPSGEELALNRASGCCSVNMARDAAAVAQRMGFRHYVVDLSREFHSAVVEDFGKEYLRGRTPNPCVRCNTFVKWQTLLGRARRMGCDFLATGHYARVERGGARTRLLRAKYLEKDQSYALWGLSQESLSRTLFPVGELSKAEVRAVAAELGLRTADKAESQDICFVPDNDYRRFVTAHFSSSPPVGEQGEIIGPGDRVLGYHGGVTRFTVGQRRGLGISADRRLYVTRIDARANRLYVAYDDECFSSSASAEWVNWVSISEPEGPVECTVKVRYRDSLHPARVYPVDGSRVRIEFEKPVRAITPGQSAVFYDGEAVLGGGILSVPQDVEEA